MGMLGKQKLIFRLVIASLFFVFWKGLGSEKRSFAQEGWETIISEADVTVEKRKLPTESLIEVRVRGKINAPMVAVMNVLDDQPRYPEWMKNSKEPKMIGWFKGEPGSRIFYNRGSPSWLLQDRDYYVVINIRCAKLQKQIQVNFTTDPSLRYPEVAKVVRLTDLHGHWHFSPLSYGTETYAEYQLYVDAGGSLPQMIKNYAVKKMAIQAFRHFRDQVYRTYRMDTISLKQDLPQLFPGCLSE